MCKLSYSTPKDRPEMTIMLGKSKFIKLSRIINESVAISDGDEKFFCMEIYVSLDQLRVVFEFFCDDVSLSFDAEIKRFDRYGTFILVDLQRVPHIKMPSAMIIRRDQIYLENIQ